MGYQVTLEEISERCSPWTVEAILKNVVKKTTFDPYTRVSVDVILDTCGLLPSIDAIKYKYLNPKDLYFFLFACEKIFHRRIKDPEHLWAIIEKNNFLGKDVLIRKAEEAFRDAFCKPK